MFRRVGTHLDISLFYDMGGCVARYRDLKDLLTLRPFPALHDSLRADIVSDVRGVIGKCQLAAVTTPEFHDGSYLLCIDKIIYIIRFICRGFSICPFSGNQTEAVTDFPVCLRFDKPGFHPETGD